MWPVGSNQVSYERRGLLSCCASLAGSEDNHKGDPGNALVKEREMGKATQLPTTACTAMLICICKSECISLNHILHITYSTAIFVDMKYVQITYIKQLMSFNIEKVGFCLLIF